MRHAYRTRPEQSNAPGPEAPHRYGSPICFLAVETALAAFTFCSAVLLSVVFFAFAVFLALTCAAEAAEAATGLSTREAVLLTWRTEPVSVSASAAVELIVTAPAEAVTVRAKPLAQTRRKRDERGLSRVVDRISPWDFR
ncbi:hypothetical protein GCM10018953_37720 [Streptosporangium nondiastaticum]